MNGTADKVGMAIKLKNNKMPIASVLMFALAVAPDIHDLFIDNTEQEAKAQAEDSNEQAWKASWEAFEAEEKTELFAQQATLRIQHLEHRVAAAEQNAQNLRDFIMQMMMRDRDHRHAPPPPKMKKTPVPKALKAPVEDVWEEDPLTSDAGDINQSEPPIQQQLAPMPSLGQMWKEKKEEKKGEFKDKWGKKE